MTWLQLIVGSAVSVLVGGMIPVVLFFLKEKMAVRQAVADWFEKKYVEDGIDSLHEFFSKWSLLSSLPARNVPELLANPSFAEVPTQPAARLAALVGDTSFQNWFNAMRALWLQAANQGDWNQLVKFHTHAASMAHHLNVLRGEFVGHAMKSKGDTYRLCQLPCVSQFNQALDRMTDDLVADPNVTTYKAAN